MTPKEMCNSCTHEITAWVHIAKTIGAEIIPERTEKCHAVKIVKTKGI